MKVEEAVGILSKLDPNLDLCIKMYESFGFSIVDVACIEKNDDIDGVEIALITGE